MRAPFVRADVVSTLLEAASGYRALGLHPIPCEPRGKRPLVKWETYQTEPPHQDEIDTWWQKWPDANVGLVACGWLAVDADGGADALRLLQAQGIVIPPAPTSRTARGFHVLLAAPGPVPDRVGLLANGGAAHIDIRGKGIIIAPPSIHPSGHIYRWEIPLTLPLPPAPQALLELIARGHARPASGDGDPSWFAEAMRGPVPEGQRNDTAARLAGFYLAKNLTAEYALATLTPWAAAACVPPMDLRELRQTVESVARREAGKLQAPAADPLRLCSVVDILRMTQSNSERVPTRIPGLDAILGGGIPARRLILAGGTTAAGKTTFVLQVAEAFTDAGGMVVILPCDEGAEPAAVRVGQQHGFLRAQVEERLESLLVKLDGELAGKALRFPDPTAQADPTIEDSAEALAAMMRERPGAAGLLVVDSIQRAQTRTSEASRSERERITDNVQTARRLAVAHDIAVLATSETNRGFYRAKRDEDRVSDQAAFAEARAEYWADVALTMRARDDNSDLVDIHVPKNRLGPKTRLVLRLDRERARFAEVDPEAAATEDPAHDRTVEEARERILRELTRQPGLSRSQLYECVRGMKAIFNEALDRVKTAGIVTAEPHGRSVLYRLTEIPK